MEEKMQERWRKQILETNIRVQCVLVKYKILRGNLKWAKACSLEGRNIQLKDTDAFILGNSIWWILHSRVETKRFKLLHKDLR